MTLAIHIIDGTGTKNAAIVHDDGDLMKLAERVGFKKVFDEQSMIEINIGNDKIRIHNNKKIN